MAALTTEIENAIALGEESSGAIAMTVIEPAPHQTFQRTSETQGPVRVRCYVDGPPGIAIEARWNGGSWQSMGSTNTSGLVSSSMTVGVGEGSVDVRMVGIGSPVSIEPVSVGEVFALWGQSNSSGRLTNNQTRTLTPAPKLFGNDYRWKTLADPTDSNSGQIDSISSDSDTEMGSIWPLVADLWLASTSCPIAFVPCSKGATGFGTSQPTWVPAANRFDRATLFGSAMNRIRAVGGVRAILWWQGEGGFDDTTGNSYITPWLTMANAVQAEFPGLKIMPAKIQQCVGVANQRQLNGWHAIGRIWSEHPTLAHTGPTLADAPIDAASNILTENEGQPLPYFHLKSNAAAAEAASRWAARLLSEFVP